MHVDHIGIAVKNLEEAVESFSKLLNRPSYKTEAVKSEQVETAFFKTGEAKVELLGPTASSSVIQKFIDKKGEGIHHIAFEVEDIRAELKRLKDEGYTILNEQPEKGADNKWVAFVHPKDNHGVLMELCQSATENEG